ncbi:DUF6082 family protein [Streptomyces sp. NPDC006668]|uniref:DUF6082 family protein n=1 Tax=Streptomyces sp. NPDC006668 TaxID=3156903 RepID=UPI0033E535E0
MVNGPRLRHAFIAIAVALASCLGAVALTMLLVRIPALQTSGSGNAGQAFGAAAAFASFFVLFYAVRTFRQQIEEFHMRRTEMSNQQEFMRNQRADAREAHDRRHHSSAEATLRGQLIALMTMAIENPALAEVWPSYGPGISDERRAQYLYANLIISWQYLAHTLNSITDDEVLEVMRYLFSSPIIHEFWCQTRAARSQITPYGGTLPKFYELADLAFDRRIRLDSDLPAG